MNILGRPTIILGSVLEGKKNPLFGRTHCQDRIKKFPKILKPSQNSKHQMSDMKKISYQASTNIRCQCAKFSHLSKRSPEIFAPMCLAVWKMHTHVPARACARTHTHTHICTYSQSDSRLNFVTSVCHPWDHVHSDIFYKLHSFLKQNFSHTWMFKKI